MKNMKILLVFGAIWLFSEMLSFATNKDVAVQKSTSPKAAIMPNFIPKGEEVYRVISPKIIAGEATGEELNIPNRKRKYPSKIIFGNNDKIISTYKIFPNKLKGILFANIYNSPQGKYVAIDAKYSRPEQEQLESCVNIEAYQGVKVFTVLDDSGRILWKKEEIGCKREIVTPLLTDDGKVILCDLPNAVLRFYTVKGQFIKENKFSGWAYQETPQTNEFEMRAKAILSGDGKHIIISRSTAIYDPENKMEHKREVVFCDVDGVIVWSRIDKNIEGTEIFFSPKNQYMAIERTTTTGSLSDSTYVTHYAIDLIDSKGELLWTKDLGNFCVFSANFVGNNEEAISVSSEKCSNFIFNVKTGERL